MYKVFINEHFISFNDSENLEWPRGNCLTLNEAGEKEMLALVHLLLSDPNSLRVYLFQNQVDKSWKEFLSLFHLIDAAGGVVKNTESKVLLIHRLGKWDLPKGKVEEGEDFQEAAIREVEEECGVKDLKIVKELEPVYHIYRQNDELILKTTHWFSMITNYSGPLIAQKEEFIEEVNWLNKEELEEKIDKTYASLRPLIKKITF